MLTTPLVDIPLIDFSPYLTNDVAGQQQVSKEIFKACHEVGFLYLTNHGIPQAAINQTFAQSQAFFSLPEEEKTKIAWPNALSNRGYIAIARERLDITKPGDIKEAFNVGKEIPKERREANQKDKELLVNRWPAEQDEFRQTVMGFFDHCIESTDRIFRAFAIALSMPPNYIINHHKAHDYTMRLLHYPTPTMPPEPGQLWAGAHTDYGSITLLFQDDAGGLEVKNKQGEWISAPPVPGAVVVNIGDLLQRWSNDIFRSTEHRVKMIENTAPQTASQAALQTERYSVVFFCQPDFKAEIACMPTCQSEKNPPKYPPIKSGEHLLSKLSATY